MCVIITGFIKNSSADAATVAIIDQFGLGEDALICVRETMTDWEWITQSLSRCERNKISNLYMNVGT